MIILEQIFQNKYIKQKELADCVNAAPSMVNLYISSLEKSKHIIRNYKSSRDIEYAITKKGISRKNYLQMSYLYELLKLYNLAKERVEEFITDIEDRNFRSLLLYGAGEVAETVLTIMKDMPDCKLRISAILDDDVQKQGKKLFGYEIVNPARINDYKVDAIVITSFTYEHDIYGRIKSAGFDEEKIISFFDKSDRLKYEYLEEGDRQ